MSMIVFYIKYCRLILEIQMLNGLSADYVNVTQVGLLSDTQYYIQECS